MGGVFRAMQQYGGLSQARIAAAKGLSQSRVNEVINGRREITKLDVLAVRGLGLLGLNDSLLRSRLTGGAPANVRMLLDPDCEATAARAGLSTIRTILEGLGIGERDLTTTETYTGAVATARRREVG